MPFFISYLCLFSGRFRLLSLVSTILCLSMAGAQAAAPKVVATLAPLHSLAAMVMQDVAIPELLVTGMVSEHGFTLKPSDARKLAAADLVLLVDPSHESFVVPSLKGKRDDQVIIWSRLPGMRLLPPRRGGVWDDDDHEHNHGHDHHDHGAAGLDGHVWLDTDNAALLVQGLADRLTRLDPENGPRYQQNARQAQAGLTALDGELRQSLRPLSDRPFVVFHDAYQYYEHRYGLRAVGSVTVDPDRPPSAKRLAMLRDRLRGMQAACIFAEPQFPSPVTQRLADAAGIGQGILDPQGATLSPGPGLYAALLRQMADNLTRCLIRPGG